MTNISYNELNYDNVSYVTAKAKQKANGVYTARGIFYRVYNGFVTHYATKGVIILNMGNFHVEIGKYTSTKGAKSLLKAIEQGES